MEGLERFVDAQRLMYNQALDEIKAGRKWDREERDKYYAQSGLQKPSYKKYTNKITRKGEKTYYAFLVENF